MKKRLLIISILTILVIWRVRVKKERIPTVVVEKIVTGKYSPEYYFLLKKKNGVIIEEKVDYHDYGLYKVGDSYLCHDIEIYIE